MDALTRKVDVRLPGKENSNSHGARPVHPNHQNVEMDLTSRLSIKNSLSGCTKLERGQSANHMNRAMH